jgi:secondary thiamine-phosphate synthase enzyme
MHTLRVKTGRRTQLVDVTADVERVVKESGVAGGVCYVYVPHTTAGVAINEHADPDVATDLEGVFDRLVPHSGPYRHSEGNTEFACQGGDGGAESGGFCGGGEIGVGEMAGDFSLRV